jgi:hypothetical protein
VRVALVVLLASCDPLMPPPPAAPSPPPVIVPPPVIENHITNYITELNIEPPAAQPAAEAPPPPARPPAPTRVAHRPAMCTCLDTAELPQGPTTTVASCDHFLAQAELAVRCETDDPGAIGRVVDALELSRRQWRKAAAGPGRADLIDSCDVADRGMTSSLADACRSSP